MTDDRPPTTDDFLPHMTLILRWIISAAAVWVAVRYVPGITLEEGIAPLFAVSLVLGGVNLLIRPILKFLACGLIFLTLGLFMFVINAAMLLLASTISRSVGIDFHVDGFGPALLGSLVISLGSAIAATLLLPDKEKRG
jgi:putative membrane protein